MANLPGNMDLLRRAYDSMKNDFTGPGSSDNNSHYRSNYKQPLQSWQNDEKWNALPETEQARLQEKRDEHLARERIKNDPLGIAKEILPDAMNPDAPAGDSPQDRIRAAEETINDYSMVANLLLKATYKGQIEGVMNTDPGERRVDRAVADLYNPKIYEELGVTREEFLAPLEQAYLDKAEANLALASAMPEYKTPGDAYNYRIEALNSAKRNYGIAEDLRQIVDKDYKSPLSQAYFDELRGNIADDRDAQLKTQTRTADGRPDQSPGFVGLEPPAMLPPKI